MTTQNPMSLGLDYARNLASLGTQVTQQQGLQQQQGITDQKQQRSGVVQGQQDQDRALLQAQNQAKGLVDLSKGLMQLPIEQRMQAIQAQAPMLQSLDIDIEGLTPEAITDEGLTRIINTLGGPQQAEDKPGFTLGKGQQRFDAQGNLIASGITTPGAQAKGAEQEFFESLQEGLTEDQKQEAVLVELGLSARAISSADITIAESPELTEQIANSKAIIGERKKFGELTGASRSKAIDSGFERIVKIDAAVRNIDNAIKVLKGGAGVGAIERFIPSFKAASVELDNIQKSMALDVIGAVTFGALSKGELDLAKEVALPTGLDSPQLIEYLQNRKSAQEKLRAYFNEQIQFLDQGGTIAGFLRKKEADAKASAAKAKAAKTKGKPTFVPGDTTKAPQSIAWDDM